MRTAIYSTLILLSFILLGCTETQTTTNEIQLIKGGKTYGGTVRFMSAEKVQSLFPLSANDHYSSRIINQLFETVFDIDPTSLEVIPRIATSFNVNEDASVYTLHIRKGVYFHNDECFNGLGRELVADDIKSSLEYACKQSDLNAYGSFLTSYIKGGQAFYANSNKGADKQGLASLKVINDYVLEITLESSFVGFEKVLTHPSLGIFPKEAVEKYGKDLAKHPVGTGPFKLKNYSNKGVVLTRNDRYWKKDAFGNQLPYLAEIEMTYVDSKKSEMMAFRKEKIDLVMEIPVEDIENVLGTLEEAKEGKNVKHKIESSNSLSIDYLGFNHTIAPFNNEQVRKAILLAINTEYLVEHYLEGEGNPANNGFVPVMDGFQNRISSELYNPEKARKLLSEAGYPDGKNFPTIEIYVSAVEGSNNHKVAQGIVAQLKKELNINFTINLSDFADRLTTVKEGKAQMWKAGWIADYPDPQDFISKIVGGGNNENDFRYNNPELEMLYRKSLEETDETERLSLLRQCAQIINDEAVVIPVLTDNMLIMVNARVKGVKANPLEKIDFTEVYIKEKREE